jgi:hypothetical protein
VISETTRARVLGLGAVLCVGAALVQGFVKLDDTLGLFDLRADQHAALDYAHRVYTSPNTIGSATLVEDARLWMPTDAEYRVVVGPHPRTHEWRVAGTYLLTPLLPRRRTDSEDARWAFCYGCDRTTLGPRFHVLSSSGDGVFFGRWGG